MADSAVLAVGGEECDGTGMRRGGGREVEEEEVEDEEEDPEANA